MLICYNVNLIKKNTKLLAVLWTKQVNTLNSLIEDIMIMNFLILGSDSEIDAFLIFFDSGFVFFLYFLSLIRIGGLTNMISQMHPINLKYAFKGYSSL